MNNRKLRADHLKIIYDAGAPRKPLSDEEVMWALKKIKIVNKDMTEYIRASIHLLKNNLLQEKNLRLTSYMLKSILCKHFEHVLDSILYLQIELGVANPEDRLNRTRILWEYWWALEGFPVLQLTEQQVAAFSISDPLNIEMFKDMRVPWKAFSIPLQDSAIPGLRRITILDLSNTLDKYLEKYPNLKEVFPSFTTSCFVELTNGTRIWNQEENLHKLLELITTTPHDKDILKNTNAKEQKAIALSETLLLNIITALNQEKVREPNIQKKKLKKSKHKLKNKKAPDTKEYRLSTPVTIDHTKYVRDYILGKTNRKYTARWMVRGHWKNQPFGPRKEKKTYRKFIEPYWKGDERNAILIRDYKLKENGEKERKD